MSARWLSLAVVVAAFTCYHFAQRSMPDGLRPAPLFAIVTVVLAVIGLAAFGEHLTPTKVAGLALCVAGGSLVVR